MAPIPEDVVHALIQRVYLAGADVAKWPEFLEAFRVAIDGGNAILGFIDRSSGGATIDAVSGYGTETLRLYDRFRHLDPFAQGPAALGPLEPGFIGLAQDLISDEELQQTEFYRRFGREHGVIGGIICVVYAEDPLTAFLGANRRPGRHFGEAEVHLARALLPHLRTALQIHRQLHHERQVGTAALATLNRLRSAVFICDAQMNVRYRNAAAAALSIRHACVREGRMVVGSRHEMTRLRQAIADAASSAAQSREHVVRLGDSFGDAHVAVVTPVHQESIVSMVQSMVAVIVHAPQQVSAEAMGVLAETYHFTPAETRVAEALLAGDSLREAGTRLRLSYESARTYMKRLLNKTGARRQAELVRILLTALPPIDPREPVQ